jgi:hypothetical protein
MKFKILKGTETYDKLTELKRRCDEAHAALVAVLDELGTDEYIEPHGLLAGGVIAIRLATKPEGWRNSDWGKGFYVPKRNNQEWNTRLYSLPLIKNKELNDIVGFMPHRKGLTMLQRPGIEWMTEQVVLTMDPESKYTPPNADIIEILESEYQRLNEAADKPAKRKRSKA